MCRLNTGLLQATDVPTNIGSRRSITGTRPIGVDLALDNFVKLGANLTACSDEIDAQRWLQFGRGRGEALRRASRIEASCLMHDRSMGVTAPCVGRMQCWCSTAPTLTRSARDASILLG